MLLFQSPGRPYSLLEHLLIESIGATSGGGSFAWITAPAAHALFHDDVFAEFLDTSEFDLLFGVDSITDEKALKKLGEITRKRPNLRASAVLHESSVLYHPKIAWFRHPGHLSVIVGSGNLTMGGLRNNFEAFSVSRVKGGERSDAEVALQGWRNLLEPELLPFDDPRVMQAVQGNVGSERSYKVKRKPTPEPKAASSVDVVLVAEIPKSGSRWKQVNFDRENYENFFGAHLGSQRRVMFYSVLQDGRLGELESRPSVEVASQNYRFELAAASGLDYPQSGPPIGVFMHTQADEFLYLIVMPGESGYNALDHLLTGATQARVGSMRRKRVAPQDVRDAWPDSPLWKADLPAL